MNKRFALWGGLATTMALIVFTVVYLADKSPVNAEINNNPVPAAAENGILAPREDDWSKGNPNANVIVVKYSDFQCPACRFYASMDDQLSKELPDDVLFIFRHFPLRNFQFSRLAATYAEAAGRQGQFWRMHDLIYINQQRWSRGEADQIFRQFAESMELDMEQFEQDLEDPALQERIDSHYQEGQQLGVRAVPTLFLKGERIQPRTVEEYRELLESHM